MAIIDLTPPLGAVPDSPSRPELPLDGPSHPYAQPAPSLAGVTEPHP